MQTVNGITTTLPNVTVVVFIGYGNQAVTCSFNRNENVSMLAVTVPLLNISSSAEVYDIPQMSIDYACCVVSNGTSTTPSVTGNSTNLTCSETFYQVVAEISMTIQNGTTRTLNTITTTLTTKETTFTTTTNMTQRVGYITTTGSSQPPDTWTVVVCKYVG